MSVGPVSGTSQSLVSMSVTPAETAKAPEQAPEETAPPEQEAEVSSPDQGTLVDIRV